MKQGQILGYTKTKAHHEAADSYEHDSGNTTYTIYVDIEGKIYAFSVVHSYGSCGSGYCGASWGNITDLKEVNLKSEIHLRTPINNIFIKVTDENNLCPNFGGRSEYYDAEVETILTTEGIELATSTGNGGCGYYPSGQATFKEGLFN